MVVKIDMIILNPTAHQKLLIFKPGRIASMIINITALITIRNKPRVNTVNGKAKNFIIGAIVTLATANKIAVKIAWTYRHCPVNIQIQKKPCFYCLPSLNRKSR